MGAILVFLSGPLFIQAIARRHISSSIRANYVDGVAIFLGWIGKHEKESELLDTAYRIRESLVAVRINCESELEFDYLFEQGFVVEPEISAVGISRMEDGSGELRFEVLRSREDFFRAAILKDRAEYRLKNAEQAVPPKSDRAGG